MMQKYNVKTILPPLHMLRTSPQSIMDSTKRNARSLMVHELDNIGYVNYEESQDKYGEFLHTSIIVATNEDMKSIKRCQNILGSMCREDEIPPHLREGLQEVYELLAKVLPNK